MVFVLVLPVLALAAGSTGRLETLTTALAFSNLNVDRERPGSGEGTMDQFLYASQEQMVKYACETFVGPRHVEWAEGREIVSDFLDVELGADEVATGYVVNRELVAWSRYDAIMGRSGSVLRDLLLEAVAHV